MENLKVQTEKNLVSQQPRVQHIYLSWLRLSITLNVFLLSSYFSFNIVTKFVTICYFFW